jgi:hypothetical protein
VETEIVRLPSIDRFAMPVSTRPGPSSANPVTPKSASSSRQCFHLTGLDSCAESSADHSSPWSWARASTLEMIGISVSRTSATAMASRKRSRAGAMYGVWNAPETGSDITRLAPSSCASADAASTPIRDPAITTCPGALKLATQTSSSARRHAIST